MRDRIVDINKMNQAMILYMKPPKRDVYDTYKQLNTKIIEWEKSYFVAKKTHRFQKIKLRNDKFASIHNYVISDDTCQYPIYKINNLFNIIQHQDYHRVAKSMADLKTSRYTYDRRVVYEIFTDIARAGFVKKLDTYKVNRKVKLFPLQCVRKNGIPSAAIKYTIIKEEKLDFAVESADGWTYTVKERSIVRTKPIRIYILDDDVPIKYQDMMVNTYRDYIAQCGISLKDKSYFGVFITEVIIKDDYNSVIFKNLIPTYYSKFSDELREYLKQPLNADGSRPLPKSFRIYQEISELDTLEYLGCSCWIYHIKAHQVHFYENYVIYKPTDKIANFFNKLKLTNSEIDALFNPIRVPKICNSDLKSNIIERKSDDDISISSDDELDNNKNLEFHYNKHIVFSDTDKDKIKNLLSRLIYQNKKFDSLVTQYTDIYILKNIDKQYTNKKYFNMILHNNISNIYSVQYHCYIQNNEISAITQIQNILI